MKRIIIFTIIFGCGGRPVISEETQPTELELLCESWCDLQSVCGFTDDYSPEGECLPNCVQTRSWSAAWDSEECQDVARVALTCLGDGTCHELAPMFDPSDDGPTPCLYERTAMLLCSP